MRPHLRITVTVLALAAALPGAALADSSSSVIADVAKDGVLNGQYSQAALKSAATSPLLKQYGGSGAVQSVTSKIKNTPAAKPQAGASSTSKPGTGTAGKLPFTGAEAGLMAIVGGALGAAGLVLRRAGRSKTKEL